MVFGILQLPEPSSKVNTDDKLVDDDIVFFAMVRTCAEKYIFMY